MMARTRSFRRAFTIIEVLVVVALLGIVAGIALPRLTGNARREAEYAADAVTDLLTLFAHRESIGASNIALGYDPEARAIMMLELRGDPADHRDPPAWRIDRFVPPVVLPDDMVVREVRQGGLNLDVTDWFIPLAPGQLRPTIELDLSYGGGEFVTTIYLGSVSLAAERIDDGQSINTSRLPFDLDAAGRDKEIW